jgi:signal transduction histidine kinase
MPLDTFFSRISRRLLVWLLFTATATIGLVVLVGWLNVRERQERVSLSDFELVQSLLWGEENRLEIYLRDLIRSLGGQERLGAFLAAGDRAAVQTHLNAFARVKLPGFGDNIFFNIKDSSGTVELDSFGLRDFDFSELDNQTHPSGSTYIEGPSGQTLLLVFDEIGIDEKEYEVFLGYPIKMWMKNTPWFPKKDVALIDQEGRSFFWNGGQIEDYERLDRSDRHVEFEIAGKRLRATPLSLAINRSEELHFEVYFMEPDYSYLWDEGRAWIVWMIVLLGIGIGFLGYVLDARAKDDTLAEAESELIELNEQWVKSEKQLKEKDTTFRNLFESSPIPMMQIEYDRITENEIARAYQSAIQEKESPDTSINLDLHPLLVQRLGEGRVEYINTAALDLFALKSNGRNLLNLTWLVEASDERLQLALIKLIAKNRTFSSFDCELLPIHGAKVIVEVDFSVVNHTRDKESIVLAFQDVTDRRKEHEAVLAAKEELESANRLKSSFFTNMSHELKTPLNAIIGFSDMLYDSIDDDVYREQLNLIAHSGRHLLGIVKDILELTKIDTEQGDLHYSVFGLQEFISDFLHPYRPIAETKKLELIHATRDEPSLFVFCDQAKLHHILGNLVDNAIKFTEQGHVELEAFHESIGGGLIQRTQAMGEVLGEEILRVAKTEFSDTSKAILCKLHFVVRDTGVGIEQSKLKRIFEPFMQGDSSVTRKYGGTGLGLTVCKKLVSALEGELVCENLKEGGCEFRLTILGVASIDGNF